ncbi:hypothetical protein ABER60_13495 [Heyndrickxia coagulans]|uniref:hypothetical protein n=1 Tax=Heyndrickxia coagulans TaxID=1398 RepID=UPI003D1E57E2
MPAYSRGVEYLPIMIAAQLLIWRWTSFIRVYNYQHRKIYTVLFLIVLTLTSAIFYSKQYGVQFCSFWIAFSLSTFYIASLYFKENDQVNINEPINKTDKIYFLLSFISGLIFLIIIFWKLDGSHSIYRFIGGERSLKMDRISKPLFIRASAKIKIYP